MNDRPVIEALPVVTPEAAEAARVCIWRLIRRLQADARFAWYCDPLTQTFEDLTEAQALLTGVDVDAYRRRLSAALRFEAPPPARPVSAGEVVTYRDDAGFPFRAIVQAPHRVVVSVDIAGAIREVPLSMLTRDGGPDIGPDIGSDA